jgi:hypothetical protein
MADNAQIIPFHRPTPAPKPARPKAQVVPIPSMSYRLLGRDLNAKAMAARLHSLLAAGDQAGAIAAWKAHVAKITAGARPTFSQAEVARMVAAYSAAVRREIDALKAGA